MGVLDGKTVLVTGAARRIGRAVALELSRCGARVAVHYRSSADEAEATAAECGGRAFQADLASVEQIGRLFERVHAEFGGLDALVNNAAVFFKTPLLETSEQDWDRLQATNLKSVYFCCQAAARIMLSQGSGRIVNISSLGGIQAWPGYAPYNASKAGVIQLTRALAVELAPAITVNSVAPGVIEFSDEHTPLVERLIARTPMARPGRGEDVAEAVRYFLTCSDYVTGQTLTVDGGLSLRT